jgi:glycosyltransferase involved in cell wall biosynthesis
MTRAASQNGNATEDQRTSVTATLAAPKPEATAHYGMVSLVIPTKNEARNLPWVLGQVPDCVDEIVLVDASVDATRTMARACRPDVVLVDQDGPGKGNALRAGFAACSGDLIVMMDADGSMSPTEIPHFVHFLRNGYDYVKGSRFMGGGGSLDITRLRHAGNWGLLTMVNVLYHANLTDLCYGYCAFDRRFLEHLDLTADGFDIEAQMTIHALKAGLRIAEVPSLELPRRSGRSNLHAFSDGRTVLRTILNDRRSNPFVFQAIQSIGAAPNEAGLADHP